MYAILNLKNKPANLDSRFKDNVFIDKLEGYLYIKYDHFVITKPSKELMEFVHNWISLLIIDPVTKKTKFTDHHEYTAIYVCENNEEYTIILAAADDNLILFEILRDSGGENTSGN